MLRHLAFGSRTFNSCPIILEDLYKSLSRKRKMVFLLNSFETCFHLANTYLFLLLLMGGAEIPTPLTQNR